MSTEEQVARWYGPSDDYTVCVHEWDRRPGGKYRVSLTHKDGNVHTAHGEFTEIIENEKLAYTWAWEEQPPLDTLVTFRLKDAGGKTELHFTHEGFPNEEAHEAHEQGWTGAMERLEGLLA